MNQRAPLSPTVVAIGAAVGLIALLGILYLVILPRGTTNSEATTLESPGSPAGTPATPAHPLAKYIELTGLRVMEDRAGQAKLAYVIVNHSPADLPELDAQITLSAGGKAVFQFPATIPSIGPYESKDLTTSIRTNLKPYELPDWQALKPTVRITSAP